MIALLVFFALALPIAIHLLSRSEGKVMLFPFLGLLPKQVASTELHMKLRQKRLLFVRLLLVLCACLLVTLSLLSDWWSQSKWRESLNSAPSSPTIIVTYDWWMTSGEQDKKALREQLSSEAFTQVDEVLLLTHKGNTGPRVRHVSKNSLLNEATSSRLFVSVPEANATIEDSISIGKSLTTPLENLWSTSQAIAQDIPADSALHIFTSTRYSQFMGEPSYVRQPATWHVSDIASITENADKPTLKIALIGLDKSTASTEQIQRIANTQIAIQSLKSVYSTIALELIKYENIDSLDTLATKYDSLLIDNINKNETTKASNIIQLSKLPSSSQSDFVFTLANAIFRNKQQEYIFSNASLTKDQIEIGGNSIAPSAISPIPKGQAHQWEKWLAILLLALFVAERIMCEYRVKTSPNASTDMHGN